MFLNSDPRDGLLSAAERELAVPCPDIAPWVSTAKASVGEAADFAG